MEDLHGLSVHFTNAMVALRFAVQHVGFEDEPDASATGNCGVYDARVAHWNQQQRANYGSPRVENNLNGDSACISDSAKHRDRSGVVIIGVLHRQRPVVWRSPEEDHQEEDDGWPFNGLG